MLSWVSPLRSSYTIYAYKVRNLVRCIRDYAVALFRFCGLQTSEKKRNEAAIVCLRNTLAWHRTDFDRCQRVIIARHFEKSDIRFSSLASQHYFRINGNLKKYGNIEIIWQTIHKINMNHCVQWTRYFSGLNLPEMSQMRDVLSPTPQSRKVRNTVQYPELFFRECGLPRLRTILDCVLSRYVFADYLIRDCVLCQCGSGYVFPISWTFFRLRNSAISDAAYENAHFVRIV